MSVMYKPSLTFEINSSGVSFPFINVKFVVPGDGGPLIPRLAFPVGFKFSCFADDKSRSHCCKTPSCIKVCFDVPNPSPSNNLEPKPLLSNGSSTKLIEALATFSSSMSFKKLVLRVIAEPFIADAK